MIQSDKYNSYAAGKTMQDLMNEYMEYVTGASTMTELIMSESRVYKLNE